MLMAAVVVFNHVRFPDPLDGFLNCICRFAVPMFFAICGYFNYRATPEQIARRLWHIVRLNILADAVHIVVGCLLTELSGGSTVAYLIQRIPDPNEVLWLLILQRNAFLGHLWYLASAVVCYGIYWVYVRFYGSRDVDYRPLYALGAVAFAIYLVLATILPAAEVEIPAFAYRNGWFTGLPMFTMGLFFREYQEQIFDSFRLTAGKLLAVLAAGFGLVVMQWLALPDSGVPLGLPLGMVGLMLLLITHPLVAKQDSWASRKLISRFGSWSTGIYLFHLTVSQIYDELLAPALTPRFGEAAPYLSPLTVLGLSLIAAICWDGCCRLLGKLRKK